jgi:hypothetical protein
MLNQCISSARLKISVIKLGLFSKTKLIKYKTVIYCLYWGLSGTGKKYLLNIGFYEMQEC